MQIWPVWNLLRTWPIIDTTLMQPISKHFLDIYFIRKGRWRMNAGDGGMKDAQWRRHAYFEMMH